LKTRTDDCRSEKGQKHSGNVVRKSFDVRCTINCSNVAAGTIRLSRRQHHATVVETTVAGSKLGSSVWKRTPILERAKAVLLDDG
jgi:hypothetical protein